MYAQRLEATDFFLLQSNARPGVNASLCDEVGDRLLTAWQDAMKQSRLFA